MENHLITLPGETGPANLNPFAGQHMYSPNPIPGGGRMPFGLGSILMGLLGNKLWPIPAPGTNQNQFDALWQRQHDMQMMQVANNAVTAWYPFQNMGGMNVNSGMTRLVASLMSQPDGLASTIMSPILGGNPVQAQMAAFANLQGIATAGMGNVSGTSISQIRSMAEAFEENFYNKDIQPISPKRGLTLRNDILNNLKEANILGLTQQQKEGMFNLARNNELVPSSSGYMQVQRAVNVIDDLQKKASAGVAPEKLLDFLKDPTTNLGAMTGSFTEATAKAIEDTKGQRSDIFKTELERMLKSPETQGINFDKLTAALVKAQKEGKTQEEINKQASILTEKMKLDDSAIGIVKKGVEEGMKKSGEVISNAVGTNLQKESISKVARSMSEITNTMLYHKVTRGVSYENSMGFNYEDLMGAGIELLKSRLIGKPGQDLRQLGGIFGGGEGAYVPKLLDAARGTFGNNLTGKQLAEQISNFVGYSDYDLNNVEDAKKLEDNLRMMKASSRITNIDHALMLNVTGQAQNMASLNPLTDHLGGRELGPLVSEAAIRTTAAAQTMSNRDVRYMGGSANMFRNRVEGAIESAQQNISTQLAAMHTYFSDKKNQKGLDMIKSYITDGSMPKTSGGWTRFLEDIAANTGVNAVDLQRYTQFNPAASRKGFQSDLGNEIMKAGGEAKVHGLLQGIEFYHSGSVGKTAAANMRKEAMSLISSGNFDKLLTDTRFNFSPEIASAWDELSRKGYLTDMAIKTNPQSKFAKNERLIKESVEASKRFDQEISYKMAKMNAPTLQRVVQAIASGNVGAEGLSSLLESIGFSDKADQGTKMLKNADAYTKIKSAGTVEDIMLIAGDSNSTYGPPTISEKEAKSVNDISKLSEKYKFKATDLEKIISSKGDMTAIKKVVANASLLEGKEGRKAAADIYEAAKNVAPLMQKDRALYNYKEDFSLESIRSHLSTPIFGNIIDSVSGIKDIKNNYNEYLIKEAEYLEKINTDKLPTSDADEMKQRQKVIKLSKTIKAMGKDQAGDVLEGIDKQMDKGYAEEGGKWKLTGAIGIFGQKAGAETVYADEKSAKAAVDSLRDLAKSSSEINTLSSGRQGAEMEVQKMKDQANTLIDMGKGITQIIGKMDQLVGALQGINTTLAK